MKNLKKLPKGKLPKAPALPPAVKAIMKKKPNFDDIQEGMSAFTDGVSAVTEGISAVTEGITAFNEGVQTVSGIMQPSHLSGERKSHNY